MLKDAEKYAEKDKKLKELIGKSYNMTHIIVYDRVILINCLEMRNKIDTQIHDIETKLDEYKDQLDADEITQLKEDCNAVR